MWMNQPPSQLVAALAQLHGGPQMMGGGPALPQAPMQAQPGQQPVQQAFPSTDPQYLMGLAQQQQSADQHLFSAQQQQALAIAAQHLGAAPQPMDGFAESNVPFQALAPLPFAQHDQTGY